MLVYNGQNHATKTVLAQASVGPMIEVKRKDLTTDKLFDTDNSVDQKMLDENKEIVFYQHQNKYHVVAGINRLKDGDIVEGRLLTSFSMKKARVATAISEMDLESNRVNHNTTRYPGFHKPRRVEPDVTFKRAHGGIGGHNTRK